MVEGGDLEWALDETKSLWERSEKNNPSLPQGRRRPWNEDLRSYVPRWVMLIGPEILSLGECILFRNRILRF